MGRKKIEINWSIVDEKLSHFCEGTEIAEYLGIDPDTLYKKVEEEFKMGFSAYKRQKRAKGETILRELQLKAAMEGSVPMQIWLGKQYLDQKDRFESKQSTNVTIEGFNYFVPNDPNNKADDKAGQVVSPAETGE